MNYIRGGSFLIEFFRNLKLLYFLFPFFRCGSFCQGYENLLGLIVKFCPIVKILRKEYTQFVFNLLFSLEKERINFPRGLFHFRC